MRNLFLDERLLVAIALLILFKVLVRKHGRSRRWGMFVIAALVLGCSLVLITWPWVISNQAMDIQMMKYSHLIGDTAAGWLIVLEASVLAAVALY